MKERLKKRILIVEDDTDTREILAYALVHDGFDVEEAPDGERALEVMRERRPDLVLLDLWMPRLGGREVMEAMQRDPSLSGVPVVTISASPAETPSIAFGHVEKPFAVEELKDAIRLALGRPACA